MAMKPHCDRCDDYIREPITGKFQDENWDTWTVVIIEKGNTEPAQLCKECQIILLRDYRTKVLYELLQPTLSVDVSLQDLLSPQLEAFDANIVLEPKAEAEEVKDDDIPF